MSVLDGQEDRETSAGPVPDEISRQVNENVSHALSKWLRETETTLLFDKWINSGLSGALLATVVLTIPGRDANGALMKICPPGPGTSKEPERHAAALVANTGFAAQHLVTQPVEPLRVKGGGSVMFQDIAGGSLRDYRPLSVLAGGDLVKATSVIVRSILADWTPDVKTVRQSPLEYFRGHLGTRVVTGGPVDQLSEQVVYSSASAGELPPWVRISNGDILPNPLSWARSDVWLQTMESEHLIVLVGCAHGDLHADNIVLPQKPRPDAKKYRLIDLAAYSADSPLARDASHLLLSLLVDEVVDLTEAKRRAVLTFLVGSSPTQSQELQVQGLLGLIKGIHGAGEEFAATLRLLDHWQDQNMLSHAANALLFAMRLQEPSMKQWYLELSCAALGRYCANLDIETPRDAPSISLMGNKSLATVDTVRALEELSTMCSDWAPTRITILIVDSSRLSAKARANISALRWKLVVDLNPSTDVDGGWASSGGAASDQRLLANGQDPIFGRLSTVWLAAAGLSDADPVDPHAELRIWRRTHYRFVAEVVNTLARSSSRSATLISLGEPGNAERAVVEACGDAFGDRVSVAVVAPLDNRVLADYDASIVRCDPSELLESIADRSTHNVTSRTATLPGINGQVELLPDLVDRFADTMDLLHSEVGVSPERDLEPGAFYRGRPIGWYELDLGLDVSRSVSAELVAEVLRPSLKQRSTLRATITHTPGAGGTTIARRAAWDLKDEHPTIYVHGDVDEVILTQAVSELALMCDTSVLLVAELVSDLTLRNAFEALRASSVPAVLLTTVRKPTTKGTARQAVGKEPGRIVRSVHVGVLADPKERLEMARRFGELVPQRSGELLELAARPSDNNVPFFYALTAFGADFEGLRSYVAQFVVGLSENDREVMIVIALCHRFCGIPVPAELFAELLGIPSSRDVELAKHLAPVLGDLLVEDPGGSWRTTHNLVAEEILRQLLTPADGTPGHEDWKASLPRWALQLIGHAEVVFGRHLPTDMKSILDRLFTTRESRDPAEAESSGTTNYTDFMEELSSPGRLQILKELVKAFPGESHYWAHLGRLLSYDAGDIAEALAATDRAITLSPKDPLLHHMRGMVFRNEMRLRIQDREGAAVDREARVIDLCQAAGDAFRKVSELDDTTEYGHIGLAQTNIRAIEFGYRISGAASYASFFSRPAAGRYRDLLAEVEESLESYHEIRGSDRSSFVAESVQNDLMKLYDNYSALLQGWRNLLDRADLAKPAVRRQLARAYRNRAGSWRKASDRDVRQAVRLLEQNLQDNPRDARSLLEWLRAARFTGGSLDRAADLVAVWAREEGTREALYYDYVLSYLLVVEGHHAEVDTYQRKLDLCRDRATRFGHRRFSYEWLGAGEGLGRLVHHSDIAEWERRSAEPAPALLARVPGRVRSIDKPTAGSIDFGHGLHAFVAPSANGLIRGRDENRRITALIGFRYDGPVAFNVQGI